MNVLVTGANGFIGRALCKRMLADGYQVRGAVRAERQMTVLPSGVERVQIGNIGPKTDWSKALVCIDGIVHLAARVHVMHDSAADPLSAFRRVNAAGTKRLAQQAAEAGVKRLVYISSVKVNGEKTEDESRGQRSEVRSRRSDVRGQGGEPKQFFSEKDVPEPQDPYAVSKWEAEQGLMAIAEETGLEVVIIRPPLVYGPGVKANFRFLMEWVRRGVPLPLGTVYNKRSFVALDNLVSFIIRCIDHPRAANEVFLISDGEDVSTTELLQKIARAFGKRSFLLPVPVGLMTFVAGLIRRLRRFTQIKRRTKNGLTQRRKVAKVGDVADRLFGSLQVDSSKARDLLGWTPVVSMDEALKRTAETYLGEGR